MERKLILAFIAAFLVAVLAVSVWKMYRGQFDNDAIIKQAIKHNNPVLCDRVKQTTKADKDGNSVEIFGLPAIEWCKQQVEAGQHTNGS